MPEAKKTCFVMMPFDPKFDAVYQEAIRPAIAACKLKCVRADELRQPGQVTEYIRDEIKRAAVCIADLTGMNSNVVYELGVAHDQEKLVVLITRENPKELPFDIRNLRVLTYKATRAGYSALLTKLEESVRRALQLGESPVSLLEEMLVPPSLENSRGRYVVAASPLAWRQTQDRGGGFKTLRSTTADQVGIRGLIQAFGWIYGLGRLPDLVDPGNYLDKVALTPANIYCVASPKANLWTGILLRDLCTRWRPKIEFKPDPDSSDLRNIRVQLHLGGNLYAPPSLGDAGHQTHDLGIVVRGPHPADSSNMMMVLAGRSALGTEAACRAVTEPRYVQTVRRSLADLNPGIALDNHQVAFYAVVSLGKRQGHSDIDPDSFKVECAGAMTRKSKAL